MWGKRFFPYLFHQQPHVRVFTNVHKELEKTDSSKIFWSFRWFSSPERTNPQQNTQWDYCLSREDAVYAEHRPASSSAHTQVV